MSVPEIVKSFEKKYFEDYLYLDFSNLEKVEEPKEKKKILRRKSIEQIFLEDNFKFLERDISEIKFSMFSKAQNEAFATGFGTGNAFVTGFGTNFGTTFATGYVTGGAHNTATEKLSKNTITTKTNTIDTNTNNVSKIREDYLLSCEFIPTINEPPQPTVVKRRSRNLGPMPHPSFFA